MISSDRLNILGDTDMTTYNKLPSQTSRKGIYIVRAFAVSLERNNYDYPLINLYRLRRNWLTNGMQWHMYDVKPTMPQNIQEHANKEARTWILNTEALYLQFERYLDLPYEDMVAEMNEYFTNYMFGKQVYKGFYDPMYYSIIWDVLISDLYS